jgi:hypothetical protein
MGASGEGMSDLTALGMDVVTEKSNHNAVGMMPSMCITPAAPSPLPMPYPLTGSSNEGLQDSPMRTKMCGVNGATMGSCFKTCHGNEPGTLKEVVSLNTTGPCPPTTGAFTVLCELGPVAFTGSMCDMNKAIMPGIGGNASDAGGAGGGGGGGGGGAGSGGAPGGPSGPSDGGGDGSGSAAGASKSAPKGPGYCPKKGSAPRNMQKDIDAHDLRKPGVADLSKATPDGLKSAMAAGALTPTGGPAPIDATNAPGGATATQGQAFWSGPGGPQAAHNEGKTTQEDAGGAATLQSMGGAAPGWTQQAGAGSGVTGENNWRTISRRSAENSSGTVDAYVVGQGTPRGDPRNPQSWKTVFSGTELPTLLHNDKVNQINFHDPTAPAGSPPVTWTRGPKTDECPAGAWSGPSVPSKPVNLAGPGQMPQPSSCPGFSLHSAKGVTRP